MTVWKAELLFCVVTYITSATLVIALFRAQARYNRRHK